MNRKKKKKKEKEKKKKVKIKRLDGNDSRRSLLLQCIGTYLRFGFCI